jgi:hypothetical protein
MLEAQAIEEAYDDAVKNLFSVLFEGLVELSANATSCGEEELVARFGRGYELAQRARDLALKIVS